MKRTWTIIGVRDVPISFKWYQSLLGLPASTPAHNYWGQILDTDGTVLLCLHEWGAHEHPSLMSPDKALPGNGLLLFFRVDHFDMAVQRARAVSQLDEEPHVNPSTGTPEFALRDPDGYRVMLSAHYTDGHPIYGSDSVPETRGINHLGLSVLDLDSSAHFFTKALGWTESGRDNSYPRTAVSDGHVRLTLWQVDHQLAVESFNRRRNVGLHHLALEVDSEERLNALAKSVADWPEVKVEFMPELLGKGPRKHMMFFEPGGNRIELIWPGP